MEKKEQKNETTVKQVSLFWGNSFFLIGLFTTLIAPWKPWYFVSAVLFLILGISLFTYQGASK